MIRTTSLAAILGLMLMGSASAQQWVEHRPDGAGYRVTFPAQPAEDVKDIDSVAGPVKTRTSLVEYEDKVFVTIASAYPVDVSADPQASLDSARSGSVRNVDGELLSEERLEINNAPARRMVIDLPQSGQVADALVILDGNHLYQAVYVGPRGTAHKEEANRFLSSFALER
jgi:hypothetical protein